MTVNEFIMYKMKIQWNKE